MKRTITWLSLAAILLPTTIFQSVSSSYSSADLLRLQWLCGDYQIPVQGYVVEGWLPIAQGPGVERFLTETLQITQGVHQTVLPGNGRLTTNMQLKNGSWQIMLQLISKDQQEVAAYYRRWQSFADKYCRNHPIGITVVASFPEQMGSSSALQLAKELAGGLELQQTSEIVDDNYIQVSGFSTQLLHNLSVNGTKVNSSITLVPDGDQMNLYIASPILYQQI